MSILPPPRSSLAWHQAGIPHRFRQLHDGEKPARGEFGEVIKAWDAQSEAYVAVKLSLRGSEKSAATIGNEYAFLKTVAHPNIQCALDHGKLRAAGSGQGQTYMVSEWIDGLTLRDAGLGPKPHAVALGVLQGLAYLHRRNIQHGDLHDRNIMRRGSNAVLIDFGAACTSITHCAADQRMRWDVNDALRAIIRHSKDGQFRVAIKRLKSSPLVKAWCNGTPPSTEDLLRAGLSPPLPLPEPGPRHRLSDSAHGNTAATMPKPKPRFSGPLGCFGDPSATVR